MSKVLKIAAIVVGVAAVVLTAGTAILGATAVAGFLGVSTAALSAITIGLSVGASILGMAANALAKKPKLSAAGVGQQLDFVADPASGEPYFMGQGMCGMDIVHEATWGDKNKNLGMVGVMSMCTISAYLGFYTDLNLTTFSGGNAVGYYNNFMYLHTQLGAMPESAALDMSFDGGMPDWTSAHKISGAAAAGVILVADTVNGKVFSGGAPKMTHMIKGVLGYDPRADSTNGGSGSQRPLNEATYAYSDNPFVHAGTYAIGRWQNGYRVMGPGLPVANIDWPSHIAAANVAAANNWKISGRIMSTDSKWEVLKAITQAGGGWPIPSGSKLYALVNTPRVAADTITSQHVRGKVTVPQMGVRRTRVNGAIPRFRSADAGWEIVPGVTVRNSTYLSEDGGNERTREVEYPLVADQGDGVGKTQAAQLVAYDIANSRAKQGISIELGLVWSQYKAGDCLRVNMPEYLLINQKCVVTGRTINVSRGTVTLVLMTEDDAKHTWALGLTGSTTVPPTMVITPGAGDGILTTTEITGLIARSTIPDLTFGVNTSGVFNISNHHRVYYDSQVSVTGNSSFSTGAATGDLVLIYYDDPTRAGGAVTYHALIVTAAALAAGTGDTSGAYASPANPYRHFVCAAKVPASAPVSGGTTAGSGGGGAGPGGAGGRDYDTYL